MLALPALWYGGLSIMIAVLPLLGARSWTDIRRVAAQGRSELGDSIARLRSVGRRRSPGESATRVD
jgi:hypothetical protein